MNRLTFSIAEFADGGFGLVSEAGEVMKAATTLDEILGFVSRQANHHFAPAPPIAERFAPALLHDIEAEPVGRLRGALQAVVGRGNRP